MNEKIKELAEKAYELKQNMVIDPTTYEIIPGKSYSKVLNQEKFAELIIEEAAKAPLCDSDGVVGKYSDSDRYYFETMMKKQLGLI
jgi:hypothetical protein